MLPIQVAILIAAGHASVLPPTPTPTPAPATTPTPEEKEENGVEHVFQHDLADIMASNTVYRHEEPGYGEPVYGGGPVYD